MNENSKQQKPDTKDDALVGKKVSVRTFEMTPVEFQLSIQEMNAWNHGPHIQRKLDS